MLLDDFEPGTSTAEVRAVFDRLKEELVPLIAEVASDEDAAFMRGPFPEAGQRALSLEAMTAFGYDPESFRLDVAVHPFCTHFATSDIRVTTRYQENDLESLFSSMHEIGHGVYERGISPALERTPLATGCSSGLHESQSRLWENVVGRSLPVLALVLSPRAGDVPRRARERAARVVPPGRQPRAPLVHPGRRRRGHLRPAHHHALRAGAGAARRHALHRRPAGGLERPLQRS